MVQVTARRFLYSENWGETEFPAGWNCQLSQCCRWGKQDEDWALTIGFRNQWGWSWEKAHWELQPSWQGFKREQRGIGGNNNSFEFCMKGRTKQDGSWRGLWHEGRIIFQLADSAGWLIIAQSNTFFFFFFGNTYWCPITVPSSDSKDQYLLLHRSPWFALLN